MLFVAVNEKMKTLFKILILGVVVYSCTTNHFVMLKSDGTAQIETDFDMGLINRLEESTITSDLDTSNHRVKFTIDNIDSIGQYLPFHNSGFLKFQNYGDSISITTGNNDPYVNKMESCCHLAIRIRTELQMEAYKKNGKKIRREKSKNYHGIWLSQTIRQQVKGRKNIDVILKKKY